VILDVLQITNKEKKSVELTILDKLQSRGIVATDICGSDVKKAHLNEIVEELKAEEKHHALFNRAKNAGEDVVEVDYAIHQLILNAHTQRKKRQKRIDAKAEIQAATQQDNYARNTKSASFLSRPPTSITPTLNQGPRTIDRHSPEFKHESSARTPPKKRMVLLYIDGETFPEMITLSKAISAEPGAVSDSTNLQLSVLKANIEERLAPRIIDWSRLTTEINGIQMKCSHQEVFAFVCEEAEQQQHITLKGLRVLAAPATLASNLSGILNILPTKSCFMLTRNARRNHVG
jgi:hypothetical protein